ncbi:hypothetical protein [Allokutzneria oryzae]|uniref:Uncharacterized protein n=1 Tax=Allokutzneria oryzae TaxID=1378989 RepID=A0ABV5ZS09_9PSEU
MVDDTTASGASTPETPITGGHATGPEPIVSVMLRERSRRTTMTSVLDRLVQGGGQFAELRADGSGWSVSIPASPPHHEAPAR